MPDCELGKMPHCQVRNNEVSNLSWFPGYKAEVEENRKRKWLNWIMMWWILALIVGSIVCGLFVMKPGIVFLKFTDGKCTLRELRYNSMKGCNCGKSCKSEFPCYTLSGTFDSYVTEAADPSNMDLFDSYWSYVKGCAFHTCGKEKAKNTEIVYEKVLAFFEKYGYDTGKLKEFMIVRREALGSLNATKTFPCWGDSAGSVFMTEIDSAMHIGVSCIPIVLFFVVVVLFVKCATPGMKIVTLRCIFLPYYCITDSKTTTTYLCNHRGPCAKGYCCY